ncbi:MAG: Lrp/AsnC family transcriptional regulator [Burkholderiaceae bacterium]|jgi:Lrp/AsnC family leucine-responsive transcriptional regulator|nr:MAG: Lrp/AsnC family transcriptional regulator [Burkholderiaceae bacterium]
MSKKKDPDSLDRAILRCLIKDARMSLQEIGAEVGLSATPCWNRIKRMEEEGLIQGYTALVDPAGLGYADTVILQVTLESHTDEMLYAFGRALEAVPEVTEAYLVSGDYDYYIRVAIKDTRDYERFLRERLYKIPGIRHSRSSFVLRCLKQSRAPFV